MSKKVDKVFVETKTIIPQLLWCPSEDSTARHQFSATKVYVLADNPEKGFAICPEHSELIEVPITRRTAQQETNLPEEVDKEAEKKSDEDFFEKQLCGRVGHLLASHTYSIEFYLQYKSEKTWLKPPKQLSRLFSFYFDSTRSEKKEVNRISELLQKFKSSFGLPCDLIDAKNIGEQELRNICALCAHRASTGRLYGKESGFSIRDAFLDYSGEFTGHQFGKHPALLVYSKEGIDFVLPHYASCEADLKFYGPHGKHRLRARTRRSARIKIYPFLVMFKTATESELKDTLVKMARAEADLANLEKR
jgi:hypothetical protein